MPDDLKPYRIVREIGQSRLESECCALMEQGYVPCGGLNVMEVAHPITGQSGIGFMQAMYRTARERIMKPC